MTTSVKTFFILIICTIIFSCDNETTSSDEKQTSSAEKCKYGSPTPIFSKDLEKVLEQSFTVNGQKGIEKVQFENGLELELLQSGCNDLFQSFQFALSKDLNGDEAFWIQQAAAQFHYLSTLSEKHFSFNLWSDVISKGAELITLGEAFEPEPNTFIKIDKIPSGDKTILVVTFEAKG